MRKGGYDVSVSMRAAVLQKPLSITLEERPVPTPGPNEVLIQVMAVGICGSDLHYYEHGRIGRRIVKKPLIQGHECSGIVVAVGNQVTRCKVGDRVVLEPGVTCGKCEWCKKGRYNLCPHVRFLSTPPVDGALAQYITHPEDFVFQIPDELSFEKATLVEPLSVGLHAAKRIGLEPGSSLWVIGMGPVGLTAVIAAKAFGVKEIIVSDLEPFRLHIARQIGATSTINITQSNPVQETMSLTDGIGVDAVIDTTSNERALDSAVQALKRGGKLALIGFPTTKTVPMNLTLILQKEIDISSIYRYSHTFQQGIEILARPDVPADLLITDRFTLERVVDAFEKARTDKKGTIKVIVNPNR